MARIETWFNQDLKKPVKVQYLDGNVFSQDNSGNLIGVNVFDNGAVASLSGTVSANVIRADGATLPVNGTLSGNKASVILPQSAYAIPGPISIVIKLTNGYDITTLCAVVANVYQSSTYSVVDPGTIIPSVEALIEAINEAVESIPEDYSDLWQDAVDTKVGISKVINYTYPVWQVGYLENTGTGNRTYIGEGAGQVICSVNVQPGSILGVTYVTSGYILHCVQVDKNGLSIHGYDHNITSDYFTLDPACVKLFLVITDTAYSTNVTVNDYNKANWRLFQPSIFMTNATGWIETTSSIISISRNPDTFKIIRKGYTAIRYGTNLKVIISGDVTVSGNFANAEYLIYDLSDNQFKFISGGYTYALASYNWNCIILGYCWNNNIRLNCFPMYYVNGVPVYTNTKAAKINPNYGNVSWARGDLSNAGAGNVPTWTPSDIGSQLMANISVNPGSYINVRFVNSGFICHIVQLDSSGVSIRGWINYANGRIKLADNCYSLYVVITNTSYSTDISLSDYNKAIWEIYDPNIYENDTHCLHLAFVGDSVTTYKGISPNLNGGGYYPKNDITSADQVYSYIAAKYAGGDVACLQAVSQSTIQYQVVDNEDRYGWADSWVNAVAATYPDVIVINLGTNDVFSTITGSIHKLRTLAEFDAVKNTDTYGAYQYMITKYQNACPKALIVCVIPSFANPDNTPSYTAEKFDAMCKLIEECATYHGCHVVDFRKAVENYINNGSYTFDKIHPNAQGMANLGRYLGYSIKRIAEDCGL